MNVLYAVSEVNPFIATGGLGEAAAYYTGKIREKSINCRVVLPLYSEIPETYRSKLKFLTKFNVPVGWRSQYCGIFEAHLNGNIYYFVDNEYYFKRSGIYGYMDDGERFTFFSRAVLEMLQHINYTPDLIHCNEWQTALIPPYLKFNYGELEEYKKIKTIFTIHNILYQGILGKEIFKDILGFNDEAFPVFEFNGSINLMKAAIETADAITTVSPSYAKEILDKKYGNGLDKILQKNSYKLTGILNGIDNDTFDPETDETILKNYDSKDLSGKAENKTALQKLFNLPVDESKPLIGMVTRLVDYKGLDLVRSVIEEILSGNTQMVMLGSGDKRNETFFKDIADKFPGKFAIKIGFFPDIARKIYAGSDFFLKPSKTECCGLSQLLALRYGTIPIVRETGGLKDTVKDYREENSNGFTFSMYNGQDMLHAINRAQELYQNKKEWEALVRRAMSFNFCWQNTADEYIRLYDQLLHKSVNQTEETE